MYLVSAQTRGKNVDLALYQDNEQVENKSVNNYPAIARARPVGKIEAITIVNFGECCFQYMVIFTICGSLNFMHWGGDH